MECKLAAGTDQPTSIPASTATLATAASVEPSAVRQEIVDFMVDYIVENEIEEMIELIDKEDIPLIEEPPARFLIVLSPLAHSVESDYSNVSDILDTGSAEQVWVYENDSLSTPADKQTAIREYQEFMHAAPDWPGIFMWGYNEFGILSISENEQEAAVYLSASCGSVCGHGVVLILVRTTEGRWEIKETKPIWVS